MNQPLPVLLIEDDLGDAVLVERMLQECLQDFAIEHCTHLEKALEALEDEDYRVILLDLSLPDSLGLSGLSKLRDVSPDVSIVVLTGLADDRLPLQALEQGAQDYLVKNSLTAELLERTIRYAVQRQQIQTENRRLLEAMKQLARQDPLTGVLNHQSFSEALRREWAIALRHARPLSCVFLDIDFFKRINDTYGHAAGDETLKAVADLLRENSRVGEWIGRLGGEEFCVLLPDTNETAALVWAERIRHQLAEKTFVTPEVELRITGSLGVSSSDGVDGEQLMIDRADEAMFVAKQLGRDQVVSHSRLSDLSGDSTDLLWDGISVGQLAVPAATSIAPWESIQTALTLLCDHELDVLPVVDDDGRVVGLIGQDDILASTLSSEIQAPLVGELMQAQLVTFEPDTPSVQVCQFFCRSAVRQVLVADKTNTFGFLRRADFLDRIHQNLVETGEKVSRKVIHC